MGKETKLKVVNKMGRPSIYTDELADEICERIAEGESLRKICLENDKPNTSTVMRWLLSEDREYFCEQYTRARAKQAENMFEELLEIADMTDEDVNRSRLKVDTRKWYLSKVLPKKFGDKLDMTTNGEKMPAPIIPLNVIQTDNSDEQDSSTD